AAFHPGRRAAAGYPPPSAGVGRLTPGRGRAGPRHSGQERLAALGQVWPIAAIFAVMLGGMYLGWFNATEGAAIGTAATLVLAVARGLGLRALADAMLSTAQSTGMIFLILLGADLLNAFLALSQLPANLAAAVQGAGLPPLAVLLAVIAVYVVLGCVMDSLSMILLTIPIFFPMIMGLDLWGLAPTEKAVWFGVLALMVVEIGLITPPVGMNVYIITGIARDIPMATAFRGVAPFLVSDACRVLLLVFFPALSLWLVRLMQ
ncbi:MAG: TRAP transporter large permease subunit, partial [Betaproteobacteria bacterium]